MSGVVVLQVGSTLLAEKRWEEAEQTFAKALAIYARTLPSTHQNVGIAQVKHGRALLGERRFGEALAETLAGHDILAKQSNPKIPWLTSARQDLVREYEALGNATEAEKYREQLRRLQATKP